MYRMINDCERFGVEQKRGASRRRGKVQGRVGSTLRRRFTESGRGLPGVSYIITTTHGPD